MSFYIRVMSPQYASGAVVLGEIAIGDHVETFPIVTTHWSVEKYQRQWLRAAEEIANGCVQRCMFVTDIQPTADSAGLSYWALFCVDDAFVIQERFMRVVPDADLFSARKTEASIPPRIQGSPEEHALVSEWAVTQDELLEFIREAGVTKPWSGL